LTECYSEGKANGEFGPIDPTKNSTFIFLKNFFNEIANVFPKGEKADPGSSDPVDPDGS